MGREIKFRCWFKNEMAQQMLYDERPGDCLVWKNQGQDIEAIMQFTGLHDKNGKEIYEADIAWDPATNKSFIVEWDEIGTGYLFHNTVIAERTHGIDYYEYEDMCTYGFEVIGNQFENPELLEQTS